MTINITKRLEWLNKRLGLSEIHKEYIGLQMKELALEVKQKTEQELKSDLLNRVIETPLEWVKSNKVDSGEDLKIYYLPNAYTAAEWMDEYVKKHYSR
jgi:hypothetical protein